MTYIYIDIVGPKRADLPRDVEVQVAEAQFHAREEKRLRRVQRARARSDYYAKIKKKILMQLTRSKG